MELLVDIAGDLGVLSWPTLSADDAVWRLAWDFGVWSLSLSESVPSLVEDAEEWVDAFDTMEALCGDARGVPEGVPVNDRADNLAIADIAGLSPGGEEDGLKISA